MGTSLTSYTYYKNLVAPAVQTRNDSLKIPACPVSVVGVPGTSGDFIFPGTQKAHLHIFICPEPVPKGLVGSSFGPDELPQT